jgi:2-polyprenyl-3-methyl-5-hydroxy-6-metoxy-1,4-benzoquinol methylase
VTKGHYQHDYSSSHASTRDFARRRQKAKKMLAVLSDQLGEQMSEASVLDVGCSHGVISNALAECTRQVIGLDIDQAAVNWATENHRRDNLRFQLGDGLGLDFEPDTFDLVICNQIYEHVADARHLMNEIHRVLKPGGLCYFSATNRFLLIEQHYNLPLLSVIPKPLAHLMLRLLGRGDEYYETHLTLWQLRNRCAEFEIIDYTARILADPVRFEATDMLKPGSPTQAAAILVARWAYWLFPGYIWLLRKKA